jgi:WD40 repeat protein
VPLPGGPSDKAGNSYERRWTVFAILDLLSGRANALRIEVPGVEGIGAEFRLIVNGVGEWHQAKRQRSRGSWTISNMTSEAILQPWWDKIQRGGVCAFVTSSGCEELAELVERAKSAESWEEFDREFLVADQQRKRFKLLMKAWPNASPKSAYEALLQVKIHLIGEKELAQWIEDRLAVVVDGNPASAAAVLAQLADDSCHRELTAEAIRERLTKDKIRVTGKAPREPAYRSVMRDLIGRTPELLGRSSEIRSVETFAGGRSGYMWLVGAPWAGKTALSAHAVQALTANIDCVAYFLQQRRSDADAKRFLSAAIPQLSWLMGEDPPDALDLAEFSALWERACQRASAVGRPLLLVVDGLDEDIRPRGLPSVASLLPTYLGDFGHVLVTSRPNPALPDDVEADHPLRNVSPMALPQSSDARQIQERAVTELGHLLRGNALAGKVRRNARQVLGSLAVARGALSVLDISRITDLQVADVRGVITRDSARVLEPVDGGKRFQFAHQALLDNCYEILDDDQETEHLFRRVSRWASWWRKNEWPSDRTPKYLLSEYPFALIGAGAYADASKVVGDPTWIAASIATVGIDVAQSAIAAVAQAGYSVDGVRRLVDCEVHHLSGRYPLAQPGYVARQLGLAALRVEANDDVRARLARCIQRHSPWLAARWTTRLVEPALIRILGRAECEVWAVAIAPDGQNVFTADDNGVIHLWETGRAVEPKVLGTHDRAFSLALSPDGRYLAAAVREAIVNYELGTGVAPVETSGWAEAIALSHHGRKMYASAPEYEHGIWGWDLDESKVSPASASSASLELTWQDEDAEPAIALALTTDDRYLVAIGHGGTVSRWALTAKQPSPVVRYRFGSVHAAALTPDARIGIVVDSHGDVHVCYPLERGRRKKVAVLDTPVRGVAIDEDGARAIALGDDGTIQVIELVEDRPPRTVGHHDEHVVPAEESQSADDDWHPVGVAARSGRGITVGRDRFLRLWSLTTPGRWNQSEHVAETLSSLSLSSDGQWAISGSPDGSVAVWETATGAKETLVGPNGAAVKFVASTPDDRHVIAVGANHEIRIWLRQQPEIARVVGWNENADARYLLAANGQRLISYTDVGEICVWDLTDDAPPLTLGSGFSPVRAVDALPSQDLVVAITLDRTLYTWDLHSSPSARRVGRQSGPPIRCVAISQDARTAVTGCDDGTIQVWNVRGQAEPVVLGEPGGEPIRSIRVCSQGRYAVTLSRQGTVRVWPIQGFTSSYRLDQDGPVSRVFFAPGDENLITGDSHGLRIWSLANRRELARLAVENVQGIAVAKALGPTGECEIATYSSGLGLTSLRLALG